MTQLDQEFTGKRKFPRRVFNHPVGILCRGHYELARAVEIGEGGVQVKLQFELKVNDKVVITFKLPGRDIAVARGEVRYRLADKGDQKTYGIQFEDMFFRYSRYIRAFVSAKTDEESRIEELKKIIA